MASESESSRESKFSTAMAANEPTAGDINRENWKSEAEKALEKADAKELYVLFTKAMQDSAHCITTMGLIANHYVGEKTQPRFSPSNDAVAAMERVALAAIDLAKAVAERDKSHD